MMIQYRDSTNGTQSCVLPQCWYHGTQAEFDQFERGRHPHDAEFNVFLGFHFAHLLEVAIEFALGLYKGDDKSHAGFLFTVELSLDRPLVFETEFDLDRHAFEWLVRSGHLSALDLRLALEDTDWSTWADIQLSRAKTPEDILRAARHHEKELMAGLDASLKPRLADHYVRHLRSLGHDGILYGNWMERGLSAIVFGADQIEVRERVRYPGDDSSLPAPGRTIESCAEPGRMLTIAAIRRGSIIATCDGREPRLMDCRCASPPTESLHAEWFPQGSVQAICPRCRGFLPHS